MQHLYRSWAQPEYQWLLGDLANVHGRLIPKEW